LKNDSPHSHSGLNRHKVRTTLQEQTSVELPIQNLNRFLCNYMVLTVSFVLTNHILCTKTLEIGDRSIVLLPMTPGYGSVKVTIDNTICNCSM
jgi:hypothetical protein